VLLVVLVQATDQRQGDFREIAAAPAGDGGQQVEYQIHAFSL
jgi:hypothetical protein